MTEFVLWLFYVVAGFFLQTAHSAYVNYWETPSEEVGAIKRDSTPCSVAAFLKQKNPCTEPALPIDVSSPAIFEARLARARYYVEMRELDAALAELDAALANEPSNISALHYDARISHRC